MGWGSAHFFGYFVRGDWGFIRAGSALGGLLVGKTTTKKKKKMTSNSRTALYLSFNGLLGDEPFMVYSGKCAARRSIVPIRIYWNTVF